MTKDLTRGTPWRLIVQFALPIMAGNLLQQLYNTADTIIVGNFNGQQALSAVGACASLTALFTALAIGFSIGAGVLALYASMLLRKGHSFEETWRKVEENVEHSRIFYYMDTLDYLRAGGRIGRVTGVIGSLLNIKPIISCNKQGIYSHS